MKATTVQLIKALRGAQEQRKMGDKAFSRHLNISDSYWWMIRHGKRRPSLNLVFTIYKRVPEANESVDAYLKQGDNE
jgi:transcriptional regulator with XRE-family HTH domain